MSGATGRCHLAPGLQSRHGGYFEPNAFNFGATRRSRFAAEAASTDGSLAAPHSKYFWRVVAPTAIVLLLCNMDRICMSVAMLPMAREFSWSPSAQGIIQSAFLWGYMATAILGGTLADRFGGKRVIATAVLFFSAASLLLPLLVPLVPLGASLTVVLLARFLVGIGEGVVLPSMNAIVATQVPPPAKARALGTIFSGFHCGNLLGLALSPAIILAYGWPALFLCFGALGVPLCLIWNAVMPAHTSASTSRSPSDAPGLYRGQPDHKRADRFATLDFLRFRCIRAIIVANFVNHWGYFVYLSWIPSYFANMHGLDLRSSSLMAFAPWIAMALGSSLAGVLADALVQRYPVYLVRRAIQVVAFLAPAAAVLALTTPGISATTAMCLFIAALGVSSLGQAGFVANMSDVAPQQAGQLFGLCNTFGSFAGIVGVSAAGFVYEATGTFNGVFWLTAVLYAVGAVAFWKDAQTDELQLSIP